MKSLDQLDWNKPFNTFDKDGVETTTTLKGMLENPQMFDKGAGLAAMSMTLYTVLLYLESNHIKEELEKPKIIL